VTAREGGERSKRRARERWGGMEWGGKLHLFCKVFPVEAFLCRPPLGPNKVLILVVGRLQQPHSLVGLALSRNLVRVLKQRWDVSHQPRMGSVNAVEHSVWQEREACVWARRPHRG
jgi:hypothetical protein